MGTAVELTKLQVGMLMLLLLVISCQHHAVSSQGPEGYFNGTSYVSLYTTLNVRGRTSFSFRTCSDGKLIYQSGPFGDFIDLSLLPSGKLELKWQVNKYRSAVHIGANLINNHWHDVDLIHYLGSVTLSIDSHSVLIANSTYHSDFFDLHLDSSQPVLIVGQNYTGCILQGAGVVLNVTSLQSSGVTWGKCPLPDRGDCVGYQVDHCFTQPCHKYSRCISLEDDYQCLCTSRYTGRNCDIDQGSLCEKPEYNQCQNGGVCQEDKTGNSTICACLPKFTGTYCETMIENSFCDTQPCRNGGTCNINQFQNSYVCTCPLGFAGVDCELNIDECQSSPCQNNGSCTDEINSYTCDCSNTGYRGSNCEVNINECEENNPCYTGSVCFDRYGDYICDCPPGFGGKNCDEEVNECDSSPCINGGTCFNNLNGYLCDCMHGFAGVICEENIDDCLGISCPNNSHCIDGINSFTCACNPGYSGAVPHCFEVDECTSGPCSNGGTCHDQLNGFSCSCPKGFSGRHCEENIDDCLSQPCTHGGQCVDGIGSYTCSCSPGYSGMHCEVDINDCIPNPCKNSLRCVDKVNDYFCECLPGWEGKNCIENIDECSSHPCLHGQCMDLPNNYSCVCDPGFSGINCEENIDDCEMNQCFNGATCKDLVADFLCECPEGFMGKTCSEDYDACHSFPCSNGGTCLTNVPSHEFTCLCPDGFSGDSCEIDINECINVVCPFGQICFDLVNTYKCGCPTGFSGPECSINIDECSSNPCVNGSCVDGVGTYACHCPSGLTGRHCETDIDECLNSPCENGICQNFHGSFLCYCRPGFTGAFCSIEFNECLSSPCRNGATCNDLINDYNCSCIPGFSGRNCETDINECASNPCQNGGACNDLINEYECQCVIGFAGINCEVNIDDCASQPCYNEGVCLDLINGFVCNCNNSGFTGVFCETNIDDCLPNPCQNGALCTDLVKDYTCNCYHGYEGKDCEIDIPECSSSPCLNNALCLENSNRTLYDMNYPGFTFPFTYEFAGGYKCICQLGFSGVNCETNINDCEGHNCVNGTCIDGINYYDCDCDLGYEGKFCDSEINECDALKPCRNGASCIDLIADYECKCVPDYGDKNCSTRLLGCVNQQCKNGALCDPYLDEYGDHAYKCLCPQGFYGELCQLSTTVSFNGNGLWRIDPQAIQTYTLQLHFRTTLPSGVISQGFVSQPPLQYILYLWDSSICLDIYKGDVKVIKLVSKNRLNDSSWKFLQVQFELNSVALNFSGVVKYASTTLSPLDFTTLLGSASGQATLDNETIPHFVGCMQDVWVNGNIMIPDFSGPFIRGVKAGCQRIDQCGNSPCVNGLCKDMWSDFQCICSRPFFGDHCEYRHKPATFGYKTLKSYAKLLIPVTSREHFLNNVDISLFLRTRKETGLIFYLGTSLSDHNYAGAGVPNSTFIIARLLNGILQVLVKLQHENPIELNLKRTLNDGNHYFLEVSRNNGKLAVKVNGTAEMIHISNMPFYAEELYLAGLPQMNRLKRQAGFSYTNSSFDSYSFESLSHFKGVIQDFRLNGEVVEFFPLNVGSGIYKSSVPTIFGLVDLIDVKEGELSDNLCQPVTPCQHNSHCNDLWNEYMCVCSKGFRGKNCEEPEPCSNNTCPEESTCENLDVGYECRSPAAFDGKTNIAHYEIHSLASNITNITFHFRSVNNGTIMLVQSINNSKYFLQVELIADSIEVRWHFGPNESSVYEKTVSGKLTSDDGDWHYVRILFKENLVYLYVGMSHPQLSEDNYTSGLNELFNQGAQVYLGYDPRHNKYFKGCLNEVRIEGILLPFSQFQSPFQIKQPENITLGCTLCWDGDCIRGTCENKTDSYNCSCPKTYEGQFCDIDVCVSKNPCENGGTCYHSENEILCQCIPKYTGSWCEKINMCEPNPCNNGGKCTTAEDDYICTCPENYDGKNCSIEKIVTCDNMPCKKGICVDLNTTDILKYNCICESGYEGRNCEKLIDFCKSNPCLYDGECEVIPDLAKFECNCKSWFEGQHCEIVIKSPCENGVLDGTESIKCKCFPGYKGNYCQHQVNSCADKDVCKHGTCDDDDEIGYRCKCREGYFGTHCNIRNECDDSKCNERGKCFPFHDITEQYFQYNCSCINGYTGNSCTEKIAITGPDDDSSLVLIILIPVMCIFILCLLIGAIIFLRMAKKKRATRGTYSPSRQEMFGSRVEMNHVMKPPPEERLI